MRTCEARHWFAYYGWVGSSSPVCVRCGDPNPHYRSEEDPKAGNTDEAAYFLETGMFFPPGVTNRSQIEEEA